MCVYFGPESFPRSICGHKSSAQGVGKSGNCLEKSIKLHFRHKPQRTHTQLSCQSDADFCRHLLSISSKKSHNCNRPSIICFWIFSFFLFLDSISAICCTCVATVVVVAAAAAALHVAGSLVWLLFLEKPTRRIAGLSASEFFPFSAPSWSQSWRRLDAAVVDR